jgi:hypothetical protein
MIASFYHSTLSVFYTDELSTGRALLTNWRYQMMKSLLAAVVATLITGTAFAAAHTAAPASAPTTRAEVKASGAVDATSKDATGKTDANRQGKMSPTGQNETSSVSDPKKEASPTSGTGMKAK